MRQYAWYSPELNVIVLQTIMAECEIVFEWDYKDLCDLGFCDEEPMTTYLWAPLGEL